jgi:hypothetical protein
MLSLNKLIKWFFIDQFTFHVSGGGGGSSPGPTSSTSKTSNIPDYAQPYVETMLGTAQQQIFNYDDSGNVTGMKPYVPYSSNPSDYSAGFSPLQQQAQSNVANMQTPDAYNTATNYATTAGLGAAGTANPAAQYGGLGANAGLVGMQQGMSYGQNATDPNAVAAYMNPYLQNTLAPAMQLQQQQFGQIGAQNQGQATQAGAFGGGRQAVMQGLNQQNQMLAQNQLVGGAYNQAYNTANQNMQQAASLGMQGTGQAMQGAGIGLQGVGAQQAAYGQLGTQAANLSNIGGQETQSALAINQAQQQAGAAQQAQQQNIINQQVQNYATAQQYPMTQLSNMSNLLRGLPMQSTTTQSYQAAPSAVSTLGGLAATGLGAYGASGGFKTAKAGGLMKSYAAGGQVAFDVGGAVTSDLENMDDAHLMQEAKSSPSAMIRQEATKILTERQMEKQALAGGVGASPAAQEMQMAGGGIVSFADGGLTPEEIEAGSNRQTPLPPVAAPITDPMQKKIVGLMDLYKNQYGYGQPSEEDRAIREGIKAQREELKGSRDQNLWRGIMMGGAKAMKSKSPYASVGVGEGFEGGLEEYTKGEKDYADQLAKLRSGELDLAKLSSADRNNLMHYVTSGASTQQIAEDAAASRLEVAKTRAADVGSKTEDRRQLKLLSLAKDFYATDIKANTDPNGIVKLTDAQQDALYQKALKRAATMVSDMEASKGNGKAGDKSAKIPAPPAGYKSDAT